MSSSIVVYNKFSFNNLVNSLGVIMKNFVNSFRNFVLNTVKFSIGGTLFVTAIALATVVHVKSIYAYEELAAVNSTMQMQKSLMEVEIEALKAKNSILTTKNASLQAAIDDSFLLPTPKAVGKAIDANVFEPAKEIAFTAGSNIADYSSKSYDTVKSGIGRFVEYVKQ